MVALWSFIILTIVLFVSLFRLKGRLDGIIIIGCIMVSNILIELSGIIININLELTQSPAEAISLWTQKIASIGTQPLLIVWIIAALLMKKGIHKWAIVMLLMFSLVAIELIFVALGFLSFIHWNVFYETLRYIIIVGLTVIYARYLTKLLQKEMIHDAVISTNKI